jgi:hypothetical protein
MSEKKTFNIGYNVISGCLTQVVPPFVVLRINPAELVISCQTTIPLSASIKITAFKSSVVPLDCKFQFKPPSVVLRIVPFQPTAVPLFASENDTPNKGHVVPLGCEAHVVPPLVVLRITSPKPTTHPILGFIK